MNLLFSLIAALLLTIIIEIPVLFLLSRNDIRDIFVVVILMNCFSNPLLNYLVLIQDIPLLPLEVLVVIIESIFILMYLKTRIRQAFLYSLIVNLVSYTCGHLLLRIIPLP